MKLLLNNFMLDFLGILRNIFNPKRETAQFHIADGLQTREIFTYSGAVQTEIPDLMFLEIYSPRRSGNGHIKCHDRAQFVVSTLSYSTDNRRFSRSDLRSA